MACDRDFSGLCIQPKKTSGSCRVAVAVVAVTDVRVEVRVLRRVVDEAVLVVNEVVVRVEVADVCVCEELVRVLVTQT